MRIRRRPQASDPATSASPAQTPQNAARNPDDDDDDDDADLGRRKSGAARGLALPPQDNAVNSIGVGVGVGAGQGAGGGDLHMRCRSSVENGHRSWDQNEDSVRCTGAVGSEPNSPPPGNVEEHAGSNGVVLPMAPVAVAAVKDEKKVSNGIAGGGGANNKKRRGPAVLLEGSRCSRVNGRGWRCSQPTLVGYSLCEHHLGKGRARSGGGGGAARSGPGQLGRTEHRPRALLPAPAAGAVTIAAAPPEAEALPGLPGC